MLDRGQVSAARVNHADQNPALSHPCSHDIPESLLLLALSISLFFYSLKHSNLKKDVKKTVVKVE